MKCFYIIKRSDIRVPRDFCWKHFLVQRKTFGQRLTYYRNNILTVLILWLNISIWSVKLCQNWSIKYLFTSLTRHQQSDMPRGRRLVFCLIFPIYIFFFNKLTEKKWIPFVVRRQLTTLLFYQTYLLVFTDNNISSLTWK